jgi:hypothetical protein
MVKPPCAKGVKLDEPVGSPPSSILSENPMPLSQFIRIPRQKQTLLAVINHEKLDGNRQTADGGKIR